MNGNQRAARQQRKRDSGPNELKLSDRGWPRKTKQAEKTRRPASVRWSAWLGPRLQSGGTGTRVDTGGGEMGAAAGKG